MLFIPDPCLKVEPRRDYGEKIHLEKSKKDHY